MSDTIDQLTMAVNDDLKVAEEGATCLVETLRELGLDGVRIAYCENVAHMFIDDLLFASGLGEDPIDAMDALYNRVTERLFLNPARA